MQITIFGASGKVGRIVTHEALAAGHDVVAFVHSHPDLPSDDHLRIEQGDIYDKKAVEKAIEGSDAVISCLGSWGTPNKDILSRGMQNIIPAMESATVRRIVSLTGAEADAPLEGTGVLHRIFHGLLAKVAPQVLQDSEDHIRQLAASSLDWTVLRSPVMMTFGDPVAYELNTERPDPWDLIHRHSVALALLRLSQTDEYAGKAPYIART